MSAWSGNLYKCCHCSAAKLSAKKFFPHLENHVAKKHVCKYCRSVTVCFVKGLCHEIQLRIHSRIFTIQT